MLASHQPHQLQPHQAKAQEAICNTSSEENIENVILKHQLNSPVISLASNIPSSSEIQPQSTIPLAHLILNPTSSVTTKSLDETLFNENEKKTTISVKDLEQKLIEEKKISNRDTDNDDNNVEEEDEKNSVINFAKSQLEDNLSVKTNKRCKKKTKNTIPISNSSTDTSSELSQSQIDRLISAVSISTSGDSSICQRNDTNNFEQFMSPNDGDSNAGSYKSAYYDQYLDQGLEQRKNNENEPISLEEEEDYLD